MKTVNLRLHNLNALPILRAILRHGNLTRAATALGLTQPALSNALKQLRFDFADPLVVRKGKEMQLTARAVSLLGQLEDSLSSIEQLYDNQSFDPANAANRFRIATTDHAVEVLGPPLLKSMMAEAPFAKLQMLGPHSATLEALMAADIDLIISSKLLLASGVAASAALDTVNTEMLLSERMVCLARADDEQFSAGLSLEDYLARPHVGYLFGERLSATLEQAYLARIGLKQNDIMFTSSYLVQPAIVAATGCLALVPESLARSSMLALPLQYAPPPFPIEPLDWSMVWHLRNERDTGIMWLREKLKECVSSISALNSPQ